VTTVGLGLGLVTVVFTVLNAMIFRADEVRAPDELFAVERRRSAKAEPAGFSRPQYEALVRETGVFSDAFAMGIISQLLTESLLLALVSAALGLGISRVLLAAVVCAVTSTWPPEIGGCSSAAASRPGSAPRFSRRPQRSRSAPPCVSSIRSPTPPACSASSRRADVRR